MDQEMSQFSISSLASNQKNLKGLDSEASPDASRNLVQGIKVHAVLRHSGHTHTKRKPIHVNLHVGNLLKKGCF